MQVHSGLRVRTQRCGTRDILDMGIDLSCQYRFHFRASCYCLGNLPSETEVALHSCKRFATMCCGCELLGVLHTACGCTLQAYYLPVLCTVVCFHSS
jgi:hypothetical protein